MSNPVVVNPADTAPIVDRGTLILAVRGFLNRDDVPIPLCIQQAETLMDAEIRWRKYVVRDTIADPGLTDELYEDLPEDFLQLRSIRFETDPVVVPEYLTPDRLDRYRGAHPGLGGTPEHYTILGTQIKFDRVPTEAPTLVLESYVKIPKLHSAEDHVGNLLLEEYPHLYLYGTLLQAEAWIKNDERLAIWGTMYERAKAMLIASDKQAERAPGPLKIRSTRESF